MPANVLDCAAVDEGEFELRYVTGALSEDEADAFEAHYMGCDRCWSSLQRAIEIRAALITEESGRGQSAESALGTPSVSALGISPPGTSAPSGPRAYKSAAQGSPSQRRHSRPRYWWPALAAAASVIVIVGAGLRLRGMLQRGGVEDVERGGGSAMRVHATAGPGTLALAWSPVRGADRYRVRLFGADGTLMFERLITDTSVSVSRDSSPTSPTRADAYWSVEALDSARRPLRRSALTPAGPPP